ncbi:hypothetical protein EXIGLDRAFT_844335 [Exidia glandulosa HHB12029]|uniref:pH-response transcription factor pacC/RIM101 n=1 Tax=Exidia glandulosa HHB12029 TaxID=1314781 RepID=A0A165C3W8_EXIGL|nr:hypothetical protein EXIGLDRAFT_844335 [Exidia glandulosa HHB12029]
MDFPVPGTGVPLDGLVFAYPVPAHAGLPAPLPHALPPYVAPGLGGYTPLFLGNDGSPPTSSTAASAPQESASDHDDGTSSDAVRQRKMHPCSMCHKSFDRPSTLRIHQRVHTLQKEHVCDLCQRRFSVASNLRRHQKKCGVDEPAATQTVEKPIAKRPRRKNSEPLWIPDSLKCFTHIGVTLKLSMPLPACTGSFPRYTSNDEQPYKTENWTGTLPGPAPKPIFRLDERSAR